ncbi:flagellar biosynthesis protein FlhA [Ketobacter alkanivorans]|uniref:Flagellar biosynthesis protein FlhA n=1 Tax=Ketobacter alkanivorans TaxID=1917421 RepID=A0A2K9LRM4_9GAMM|nr:flagellar biosynthesis protein FlhA [Ketobacter alkanivorans]AUM14917.1 flagellar biosynthesis protein FlhA [Ketobacter alkanivorans]
MLTRLFGQRSELVLVLSMVGILMVLFTPIPAWMLDFLLIINFSFGLLVLLLTFYTDKPLEFSTFPSLLLIATLFRLSLNIAATRLILSDGYAGEVIGAIGEFVVGGNYIIGLVVFSILIVVQFVVVTNGAQRVAEVAARFTLDSMPGKQMSIDADLNMGLIDETEARERRKAIEKEANFYGAMDGASKFVKGDAIAGIIIILIDIIGGLTIGLVQKGMSWSDALHNYTLLTVGDGIVTQIPALIISTATGIIVTRAATDALFGEELTNQVARYPRSLLMVAGGLFFMLFFPGIPALPVLVVGALVGTAAYFAFKNSTPQSEEEKEAKQTTSESQNDDLYQQIQVDPIEIFVGDDLVDMLGRQSGQFTDKIKQFRKNFAFDMGFVIPSVKVKEKSSLRGVQYVVNILGAKVAEGELYPELLLAISPTEQRQPLDGWETRDPTYGLPSVWIDPKLKDEARSKKYTLIDPMTVIITHVSEILKSHSFELLTRTEIEKLLERVRSKQPAVVEELVPNMLAYSDLQKVMQILLREKVSVRNIEQILEAMLESGRHTKDPEELAERVRTALSRAICEPLLDDDGKLQVLSFDPALEQLMQTGLRQSESKVTLLVDPKVTEEVIRKLATKAENLLSNNVQPVLMCSPNLRRHIRKLIERVLPHVSVLSLTEIPTSVHIVSAGVVDVARDTRKLPGVLNRETLNA